MMAVAERIVETLRHNDKLDDAAMAIECGSSASFTRDDDFPRVYVSPGDPTVLQRQDNGEGTDSGMPPPQEAKAIVTIAVVTNIHFMPDDATLGVYDISEMIERTLMANTKLSNTMGADPLVQNLKIVKASRYDPKIGKDGEGVIITVAIKEYEDQAAPTLNTDGGSQETMMDVSAQGNIGEFMISQHSEIEVGTSSVASNNEYVQLLTWGFRGHHIETKLPHSLDDVYSYTKGDIDFKFTCSAPESLITDLASKYNVGNSTTDTLSTYHWRIRYITQKSPASYKFIEFDGKLKNFNINWETESEQGVHISAIIRLQDDEGRSTGRFPGC